MIRKLLGVSALSVLMAALLVVIDAGITDAMPSSPASGSVTCAIKGKGKFSPKLTLAGVATTAVKLTFKANSGPASGPPGCSGTATVVNSAGTTTPVTVTGVKIKGAGYLQPTGPGNANSCPVFTSSDSIGSLQVKFIWNASPPISNTVLTFNGGTAPVVSGTPFDTMTFPATGTTTTGTGSFTPPVSPIISLLTNIVSTCGSGWGPYPTFQIKPGSSISLP